MTQSHDAEPIASPSDPPSDDATARARPDDIVARRTALRELTAMIGVEVFY